MRLISIGEILWDLIGTREYLGGAPFNFSVQVSRLGHDVAFISAVGEDRRGRTARQQAAELGVSTRFLQSAGQQTTGVVAVAIAQDGQPTYAIERPAAYDFVNLDESDLAELTALEPEWIYYGTLHSLNPHGRNLLQTVIDRNPGARRFYDVNLRNNSFTTPLVVGLLRESNVVKLNDSELRSVEEMLGTRFFSLENFCRQCASRFGWWSVCVTRGENGCALLVGDKYEEVDGYRVPVADSVGAGDAFSAGFLHGLQAGWPPAQIGDFANRMGAVTASLPGAVAEWSLDGIYALARSVDAMP